MKKFNRGRDLPISNHFFANLSIIPAKFNLKKSNKSVVDFLKDVESDKSLTITEKKDYRKTYESEVLFVDCAFSDCLINNSVDIKKLSDYRKKRYGIMVEKVLDILGVTKI